jgi:hypothetical protein
MNIDKYCNYVPQFAGLLGFSQNPFIRGRVTGAPPTSSVA